METHSALTGPSMNEVISLIVSSRGRPTFARSEGLVVTPSAQPITCAIRISFTSAQSMKNFMALLYWVRDSCEGVACTASPSLASTREHDRRQDGTRSSHGVKAIQWHAPVENSRGKSRAFVWWNHP